MDYIAIEIPLPPSFRKNISGNVGARQTGGAAEAALIQALEGRSPKGWRVVDARGASERFPTTVSIPDSLTMAVTDGWSGR